MPSQLKQKINAKDFLKKIAPQGKESKLKPWLKDLHELKSSGCSNAQLQQFLKENDVEASISSIQKYMWRICKDGH